MPRHGGVVKRIAVTGHRGPGPSADGVVGAELRATLLPYAADGFTGVCLLGDGADELFARTVLAAGGRLEAVVLQPRAGVAERTEPADLMARCVRVRRVPCDEVTGAARVAAGLALLQDADLLVAVWDGKPTRGPGDTAEVVQAAHRSGVPVVVLWPEGVPRRWPLRQVSGPGHVC